MTGAPGTPTVSLTTDFDSVAGNQDVDVDITFAVTDTANKETLQIQFIAVVPDKTKLLQANSTGTLKVSLRGSTTLGEVPVFASNSQKDDDAIEVQLCACYLLYSWLPNTGDGAFDAGLTVSNTTADPAVIGTKGQTGDVTLSFWKTDGTIPAASPVTLATALGPGETASGVVSTLLGEPFLGYAIAVAEFQLCHGFAFINSPQPGTGGAFAQGYLPLIINDPRLAAIVPAITESAGH